MDKQMKYKVIMIYDYGEFPYGTYDDRDKANEVGHMISQERDCDIRIEEVRPNVTTHVG